MVKSNMTGRCLIALLALFALGFAFRIDGNFRYDSSVHSTLQGFGNINFGADVSVALVDDNMYRVKLSSVGFRSSTTDSTHSLADSDLNAQLETPFYVKALGDQWQLLSTADADDELIDLHRAIVNAFPIHAPKTAHVESVSQLEKGFGGAGLFHYTPIEGGFKRNTRTEDFFAFHPVGVPAPGHVATEHRFTLSEDRQLFMGNTFTDVAHVHMSTDSAPEGVDVVEIAADAWTTAASGSLTRVDNVDEITVQYVKTAQDEKNLASFVAHPAYVIDAVMHERFEAPENMDDINACLDELDESSLNDDETHEEFSRGAACVEDAHRAVLARPDRMKAALEIAWSRPADSTSRRQFIMIAAAHAVSQHDQDAFVALLERPDFTPRDTHALWTGLFAADYLSEQTLGSLHRRVAQMPTLAFEIESMPATMHLLTLSRHTKLMLGRAARHGDFSAASGVADEMYKTIKSHYVAAPEKSISRRRALGALIGTTHEQGIALGLLYARGEIDNATPEERSVAIDHLLPFITVEEVRVALTVAFQDTEVSTGSRTEILRHMVQANLHEHSEVAPVLQAEAERLEKGYAMQLLTNSELSMLATFDAWSPGFLAVDYQFGYAKKWEKSVGNQWFGFYLGAQVKNIAGLQMRISGGAADIDIDNWALARVNAFGGHLDLFYGLIRFQAHMGYKSVIPEAEELLGSAAHLLDPIIHAAEEIARRVWAVIEVLEDVWTMVRGYLDEVKELVGHIKELVDFLEKIRDYVNNFIDTYVSVKHLEDWLLEHVESTKLYKKVDELAKEYAPRIEGFLDKVEPQLEKTIDVITSGDLTWLKNDKIELLLTLADKLLGGEYIAPVEAASEVAEAAIKYLSTGEPMTNKTGMESIDFIMEQVDFFKEAADKFKTLFKDSDAMMKVVEALVEHPDSAATDILKILDVFKGKESGANAMDILNPTEIDVHTPVNKVIESAAWILNNAANLLNSGVVTGATRLVGEVPDYVQPVYHGVDYVHKFVLKIRDTLSSAIKFTSDISDEVFDGIEDGVQKVRDEVHEVFDAVFEVINDVDRVVKAVEEIASLDWLVTIEDEKVSEVSDLLNTVLNATFLASELENAVLDMVHLQGTEGLVDEINVLIHKVLDFAWDHALGPLLEKLNLVTEDTTCSQGGELQRLATATQAVGDYSRNNLEKTNELLVRHLGAERANGLLDVVTKALEAIEVVGTETSQVAEFGSKTMDDAKTGTNNLTTIEEFKDDLNKFTEALASQLVFKMDEELKKVIGKLVDRISPEIFGGLEEFRNMVVDATQKAGQVLLHAIRADQINQLMLDVNNTITGYESDLDNLMDSFLKHVSEVRDLVKEVLDDASQLDVFIDEIDKYIKDIEASEKYLEPLRGIDGVRSSIASLAGTAATQLKALSISSSPIPVKDVMKSADVVQAQKILEDFVAKVQKEAAVAQQIVASVAPITGVVDDVNAIIDLCKGLPHIWDKGHATDGIKEEVMNRVSGKAIEIGDKVKGLLLEAELPTIRYIKKGLDEVQSIMASVSQSAVANAYRTAKVEVDKVVEDVLVPLRDKYFPMFHDVLDSAKDLSSAMPELLHKLEEALGISPYLKEFTDFVAQVEDVFNAVVDEGIDNVLKVYHEIDDFVEKISDLVDKYEPNGLVMQGMQTIVDFALPASHAPDGLPDPSAVPYCGGGICPRAAHMIDSKYRDVRMIIDSTYFTELVQRTSSDASEHVESHGVLPGLADGFVPAAVTYYAKGGMLGKNAELVVAYNHFANANMTQQPNILIVMDPKSFSVKRVLSIQVSGESLMRAHIAGVVVAGGHVAISYMTSDGSSKFATVPISEFTAAIDGANLVDASRTSGPTVLNFGAVMDSSIGIGSMHVVNDGLPGMEEPIVLFSEFSGKVATPFGGSAEPGLVERLFDWTHSNKNDLEEQPDLHAHGSFHVTKMHAANSAANGGASLHVMPTSTIVSMATTASYPIGNDVRSSTFVRQGGLYILAVLQCSTQPGSRCRNTMYEWNKFSTSGPNGAVLDSVPVPAGAVGMAYSSLFDIYRGHIIFASAALPVAESWRQTGHPLDDSVYRMAYPQIDTNGPKVSGNEVKLVFIGSTVYDDILVSILTENEQLIVDGVVAATSLVSETRDVEGNVVANTLGDKPPAKKIFEKSTRQTIFHMVIPIGPVMIHFEINIGFTFVTYYGFSTNLMDSISGFLEPRGYVLLQFQGYASLFIVRGGIGCDAKILDTALVPSVTVGVLMNPPSACINCDLLLIPLSVRIYAFLEWRVCFHCGCYRWHCHCSIEWCHRSEWNFFYWQMKGIDMTLFTFCIGDKKLAEKIPHPGMIGPTWGAPNTTYPAEYADEDWEFDVPAWAEGDYDFDPLADGTPLRMAVAAGEPRLVTATTGQGYVVVSWSDCGLPFPLDAKHGGEQSVGEFRVSLGRSAGAKDLVTDESAGIATSKVLNVPSGVTHVFATVDAVGRSGKVRNLLSNMRLDVSTSAPSVAQITPVTPLCVDGPTGAYISTGYEAIRFRAAMSSSDEVKDLRFRVVTDSGEVLAPWKALQSEAGIFTVHPQVQPNKEGKGRSFKHKDVLHIQVASGSKTGNTAKYNVATILIDRLPPHNGEVHFTSENPFIGNSRSVNIAWSGSFNDVSAIVSRKVCLSSRQTLNNAKPPCDVLGWTETSKFEDSGSYTITAPAPWTTGQVLYASMRTENAGTLFSYTNSADFVTVDVTAPGIYFLANQDPSTAVPVSANDVSVKADRFTMVGGTIRVAIRGKPVLAPIVNYHLKVTEGTEGPLICESDIPLDSIPNFEMPCALPDGVSVVSHVTVTASTGLFSIFSSSGIKYVSTAPDISNAHLYPGLPDYMRDIAYNVEPNKLYGRLVGVSDLAAGIQSAEVQVMEQQADGSYKPGESNTMNWNDEGRLALHDLHLEDNKRYKLRARVTSYAGYTSDWVNYDSSKPGMLEDLIDPQAHRAWVGETKPAVQHPKNFQWWTTGVALGWEAFTPSHAPMSHYLICFGTVPGRCNLMPFVSVDSMDELNYVAHGMTLVHGMDVHATVRGFTDSTRFATTFNTSDLTMTIDTHPPVVEGFKLTTASGLHHVSGGNLWVTSSETVHMEWNVTNELSGLKDVSWFVGTQPYLFDVYAAPVRKLAWDKSTGLYPKSSRYSFSARVSEFFNTTVEDPDSLVSYYISAQGTTGAGLAAKTLVGLPIRIDDTPPEAGRAYFTGPTLQFASSVTQQSSDESVCFTVHDFHDLQSGVWRYFVELVDADTDKKVKDTVIEESVHDYSDIGGCFTDLKLKNGGHYVIRVRAQNYAGLKSSTVETMTSLLIDTTPPVFPEDGKIAHGLVQVNATEDQPAIQSASDQLHLSWSEFLEPETEVSGYFVCYGFKPATDKDTIDTIDCSLLQWYPNAAPQSHQYGLDLTKYTGVPIYAHVYAINTVGLSSKMIHSPGLLVVTSRPNINDITLTVSSANAFEAAVQDAIVFGEDRSTGHVLVTWNITDPGTALSSLSLSVGTSPFYADFYGPITLTPDQTEIKIPLASNPLPCDTALFATVVARNRVNYEATGYSDAGIVTCTPPAKSRRVIPDQCLRAPLGVDCCVANREGVLVRWDPFVEKSVRIDYQEIGICEGSACTAGEANIAPFVRVAADALEARVNVPATVEAFTEFNVVVRAVNTGGLGSFTTSLPVRLVDKAPSAGVVHNTLQWNDIAYQRSIGALFASWTGPGHTEGFDGGVSYYNVSFGLKSDNCQNGRWRVVNVSPDNRQQAGTGMELKVGDEYCSTVCAFTCSGLSVCSTSTPVVPDNLPAPVGKLEWTTEDTKAVETITRDASTFTLHPTLFNDGVVPLRECRLNIGQSPYSYDVVKDGAINVEDVSAGKVVYEASNPVPDGIYYGRITCTSETGLTTSALSGGLQVCRTAPEAGWVNWAYDIVEETNELELHIESVEAHDYRVGIAHMEFGLTAEGHTDVDTAGFEPSVTGWLPVDLSARGAWTHNIDFNSTTMLNKKFAIAIRVTNRVNLVSSSVSRLLVIAEKHAGVVQFRLPVHGYSGTDHFTADAHNVAAYFTPFRWYANPVQSISATLVDVSNGAEHSSKIGSKSLGVTDNRVFFTGLSLTNLQKVVVRVEVCFNKLSTVEGGCLSADSPVLTVSNVAPAPATIVAVGKQLPTAFFMKFTSDIDDGAAPVGHFEVDIGTFPGDDSVLSNHVVNPATVAGNTYGGSVLINDIAEKEFYSNGLSMFVSVRTVAAHGLSASSERTEGIVLADLAPIPPRVVARHITQGGEGHLVMNFTAAVERAVSPIRYVLCAGSQPGECFDGVETYDKFAPYETIDLGELPAVVEHVQPGREFFMTVFAINELGLQSFGATDALRYTSAPPPDFGTFTMARAMTHRVDALEFAWSSINDFDTGIQAMMACVETQGNTCDVFDWTPLHDFTVPQGKASLSGLNLNAEESYHVRVRVFNGAMQHRDWVTDATLVTAQQPQLDTIQLGNDNSGFINCRGGVCQPVVSGTSPLGRFVDDHLEDVTSGKFVLPRPSVATAMRLVVFIPLALGAVWFLSASRWEPITLWRRRHSVANSVVTFGLIVAVFVCTLFTATVLRHEVLDLSIAVCVLTLGYLYYRVSADRRDRRNMRRAINRNRVAPAGSNVRDLANYIAIESDNEEDESPTSDMPLLQEKIYTPDSKDLFGRNRIIAFAVVAMLPVAALAGMFSSAPYVPTPTPAPIHTQYDSQSLTISWNLAEEPVPGKLRPTDPTEFVLSVGHAPGSDDVVAMTSLGLRRAHAIRSLGAKPGDSLYAAVRVRDGSGELSDPVVSQRILIAEDAPTVFGGLKFTHSGRVSRSEPLGLQWSTPVGLIQTVKNQAICIGSRPYECDITSMKNVGASASSSIVVLPNNDNDLPDHMWVYATLSITSSTGAVRQIASDGVLVIASPPKSGAAYNADGAVNHEWQASRDTLTASWEFEGDVAGYLVEYGLYDSENLLTSCTGLGSVSILDPVTMSSALTNLELHTAQEYCVRVCASTLGRPDGMDGNTELCRQSPPVKIAPEMPFGTGLARFSTGSYQDSLSHFRVHWSGFATSTIKITSYTVALGSRPFAEDIMASRPSQPTAHVMTTDVLPGVAPGSRVFATVCAIGETGQYECASSTALLCDNRDVVFSGVDAKYELSKFTEDKVTATYKVETTASISVRYPEDVYYVGVLSESEAQKIKSDPGLAKTALKKVTEETDGSIHIEATVQTGRKYVVMWYVESVLGKTAIGTSTPHMLSVLPPQVGSFSVDAFVANDEYIVPYDAKQVVCALNDDWLSPESPIAEFRARLVDAEGTLIGTEQVFPVNTGRRLVLKTSRLQALKQYTVEVTAVSSVGLTSKPAKQTVTVENAAVLDSLTVDGAAVGVNGAAIIRATSGYSYSYTLKSKPASGVAKTSVVVYGDGKVITGLPEAVNGGKYKELRFDLTVTTNAGTVAQGSSVVHISHKMPSNHAVVSTSAGSVDVPFNVDVTAACDKNVPIAAVFYGFCSSALETADCVATAIHQVDHAQFENTENFNAPLIIADDVVLPEASVIAGEPIRAVVVVSDVLGRKAITRSNEFHVRTVAPLASHVTIKPAGLRVLEEAYELPVVFPGERKTYITAGSSASASFVGFRDMHLPIAALGYWSMPMSQLENTTFIEGVRDQLRDYVMDGTEVTDDVIVHNKTFAPQVRSVDNAEVPVVAGIENAVCTVAVNTHGAVSVMRCFAVFVTDSTPVVTETVFDTEHYAWTDPSRLAANVTTSFEGPAEIFESSIVFGLVASCTDKLLNVLTCAESVNYTSPEGLTTAICGGLEHAHCDAEDTRIAFSAPISMKSETANSASIWTAVALDTVSQIVEAIGSNDFLEFYASGVACNTVSGLCSEPVDTVTYFAYGAPAVSGSVEGTVPESASASIFVDELNTLYIRNDAVDAVSIGACLLPQSMPFPAVGETVEQCGNTTFFVAPGARPIASVVMQSRNFTTGTVIEEFVLTIQDDEADIGPEDMYSITEPKLLIEVVNATQLVSEGINGTTLLSGYATDTVGQKSAETETGESSGRVIVQTEAGSVTELIMVSSDADLDAPFFTQIPLKKTQDGTRPIEATFSEFFADFDHVDVASYLVGVYEVPEPIPAGSYESLEFALVGDSQTIAPATPAEGQSVAQYNVSFTKVPVIENHHYTVCATGTDLLGFKRSGCSASKLAVLDVVPESSDAVAVVGEIMAVPGPEFVSNLAEITVSWKGFGDACVAYTSAVAVLAEDADVPTAEEIKNPTVAWLTPNENKVFDDSDRLLDYHMAQHATSKVVKNQRYVGLVRCFSAVGTLSEPVMTAPFRAGQAAVLIDPTIDFGADNELALVAIDTFSRPCENDIIESAVALELVVNNRSVSAPTEFTYITDADYLHDKKHASLFQSKPSAAVVGAEGANCDYRIALEVFDRSVEGKRSYLSTWAPQGHECVSYRVAHVDGQQFTEPAALPFVFESGKWRSALGNGVTMRTELDTGSQRFRFCGRNLPAGLAVCVAEKKDLKVASTTFDLGEIKQATCASPAEDLQKYVSGAVGVSRFTYEPLMTEFDKDKNVYTTSVLVTGHAKGADGYVVTRLAKQEKKPLDKLAGYVVSTSFERRQSLFGGDVSSVRPTAVDYCGLGVAVSDQPVSDDRVPSSKFGVAYERIAVWEVTDAAGHVDTVSVTTVVASNAVTYTVCGVVLLLAAVASVTVLIWRRKNRS